MREPRILIVDETQAERLWLQQVLSGVARLETCPTAATGLAAMAREPVDLVIYGDPGKQGTGPRLVSRLHREHPSVDIVLLASEASAERLRSAPPVPAFVLVRPAAALELRQVVEQLLVGRRLVLENEDLSERVRTAEACRILAPCLDPGEVYPATLELLLELLSKRRGIALFRRASPLGRALAVRGFSEDEAGRLHEVLTRQKPIDPARYVGVDVVDGGPLHAVLRDAGVSVEGLLSVPIHGDDQEAGVIWVFDDARPFSESEMARAEIVSGHAIAALRNAERYHNAKERAFVDDVTEIYNVRYLLAAAENEIRRAERYENPLSLLFLDVDRFKLVNDRYGHLVGSQTLRGLSQLLLQCVRQVDTLARYGGDEFTILLVDTAHDAAMAIAERIRRTVEEHLFEVLNSGQPEARAEGQLRLAISIGVASFPEHASERDPLLDAADKAMYRAKSLGRNRVCSAADL
ncbi:MAG: diguanylate cyclase [Myxococcota bacterium]|nr:diguanylate cyclase [Myxococcota bacterium]